MSAGGPQPRARGSGGRALRAASRADRPRSTGHDTLRPYPQKDRTCLICWGKRQVMALLWRHCGAV
jgi:hypothetical protein